MTPSGRSTGPGGLLGPYWAPPGVSPPGVPPLCGGSPCGFEHSSTSTVGGTVVRLHVGLDGIPSCVRNDDEALRAIPCCPVRFLRRSEPADDVHCEIPEL